MSWRVFRRARMNQGVGVGMFLFPLAGIYIPMNIAP